LNEVRVFKGLISDFYMEWFADGFRVELVEPRDRVEHLIMGWTTEDADAKWNSPGGGEPSVFSDTQREIMRKMESAVKLLTAAFEFVITFYISNSKWVHYACHPYFFADGDMMHVDLKVEMWYKDQISPECCLTLVVEPDRGHLLVSHSIRAKCKGKIVCDVDWEVGSFKCDLDRVRLEDLVEVNASNKKGSDRTIGNYIAVATKKMLFIMAVNCAGKVIQEMGKPPSLAILDDDVVVKFESHTMSITFSRYKETIVSVHSVNGNVEVQDLEELVHTLKSPPRVKDPTPRGWFPFRSTDSMLVLSQVDRLLDVCLTDQLPFR
jgi:hypothetical protein